MHEAAIFLSIKTHTQEDTNKNLFELSPPMASDTNQFFWDQSTIKTETTVRNSTERINTHYVGIQWVIFESGLKSQYFC